MSNLRNLVAAMGFLELEVACLEASAGFFQPPGHDAEVINPIGTGQILLPLRFFLQQVNDRIVTVIEKIAGSRKAWSRSNLQAQQIDVELLGLLQFCGLDVDVVEVKNFHWCRLFGVDA